MKELSVLAAWIAMSLGLSGCTNADEPQTPNQNDSNDYPLIAEVISRDSERIRIRYLLSNNTTQDRLIFEVGSTRMRAILNDERNVRLFKGQYDNGTQFDEPQFIAGQILKAGGTIEENIERPLPLILDFSDNTEFPIDTFEFCIGHADPTDQVLTGDPVFSYYLNGLTELSRNECVMLSSE